MIELVFDDSACGCLKLAQRAGRDGVGGSIGVIVSDDAGCAPSPAKLRAAQQNAERRRHEEQARAVPLGGDASDVFSLPLALSTGPLSGGAFGAERAAFLQGLMRFRFSGGPDAADSLRKAQNSLHEILERTARGEPLRIWADASPDCRCALCWLFAQLEPTARRGGIFLVELPAWEERSDGSAEQKHSWGEIAPGDVASCLPLQRRVPDSLVSAAAHRWRILCEENAPLRAVVNGRLCSVPEEFYDAFLRQELDARPETFREAEVIAHTMIRRCSGVSDVWLAHRIDAWIHAGLLLVVSPAPEGHPAYARVLQKNEPRS